MIPSQLYQLPGFDAALGLSRCGGSEERYLKILKVFIKDLAKMAKEIKPPAPDSTEADLSLLTIKFHAVKSSAASVGAFQCSETARVLEADSKSDNRGALSRERVESFASSLNLLADQLREILGLEVVKAQSGGSLDKRSLDELRQALTVMNVRRADILVDELANQADRPRIEILEAISGKILMAEFSEALELVDKLESLGVK
jgi:HPt (histidine-containing phosphotransfer) domain-containing protein